jgi:hypothetical protein
MKRKNLKEEKKNLLVFKKFTLVDLNQMKQVIGKGYTITNEGSQTWPPDDNEGQSR